MKAGPKSCLLLCSSKKEIKLCKVSVEGTLYEFLCLCFGLNSAPLLFTKTSKVTISLLRRLHIRVIIYLDNMLLKSQTLGELQSRVQYFSSDSIGICSQFEKVLPSASPKNRTSGLGDSTEMKQFLLQRKVEKIVQVSQNAIEGSFTLKDLTKLLKKLTSIIQAILPVKLQIRFMQQIQALRKK